MQYFLFTIVCLFCWIPASQAQTVTNDTGRVSNVSHILKEKKAHTVDSVSKRSQLVIGDLSGNKKLKGGGKLYHLENDTERILLLQRPGISVMDTLDVTDIHLPEFWTFTLEKDFNHYAVFTAACGSNYCRTAFVLNKDSGTIFWGHEDFLDVASDRPEGEVIYCTGRGNIPYELHIYDIKSGKTETYKLPKDMWDCPAPAYCIDAVKANSTRIRLTYSPGENAKAKTIRFKRKAGKIIKEE